MVVPKGAGSENMGAVKMLKPADGLEGAKKFILDTVRNAGGNHCPPIVVGIGVGGTMEKAPMPVSYTHLDVYKRQCATWWR